MFVLTVVFALMFKVFSFGLFFFVYFMVVIVAVLLMFVCDCV